MSGFNRLPARRTRQPMLLGLVFSIALVLVGVTASALVAVTSNHVWNTTLANIASRDATLIELFVNGTLASSDLDADGPDEARAEVLSAALDDLREDDGLVRLELRTPDGRVLAADDPSLIGTRVEPSAAMREALSTRRGTADLLESADAVEAAGAPAWTGAFVQEYLPIVSSTGEPLAVIAAWREGNDVVAGLEGTRRDVMLVTIAAGVLLAGILWLVFRAAQSRLTRQHRQLLDATRRDALTGMLNHGTIAGLLAESVESALGSERTIAVVLLDVDNFRLFNDTHGHEAADEVLLRVAALVQAEASDATRVARYGPDEFLLVLDPGSAEDASAAAERIRAALELVSVRFGDSEELPVTVSVGIAAFPEHAEAVTELLSAATVALGEAKASGGDQVRVGRVGEEETVSAGSFDVLQGLVIAVDTKDRYTKRHSEDVARYAVFLAHRLGLDDETRRTIQLAGLLHDIGKIGIPDNVLRKPSKLTAEEFGMFQQHVVLGDAIVRDVPNAELVRAGIKYHHERWDGRGYVEGLEGDGIPLIGRVLAVADAFSAMTTTRPYRKALPIEEALKRLEDAAGTQLQEELVAAFIEGIETDADAPLPGSESSSLWKPQLWVA